MRRRCSRLLHVLVVLGLLLSGHVAAPLSIATGEARVVAPAGAAEADDVPALASTRAIRKQERREDRKQDRQRDRSQADRKQADARKDREQDRKRAAGVQEQGREGNWREFCTGPDSIRLPKVDLCIHGGDPAPAGFDVEQPVDLPSAEAAMQGAASLLCDGDGDGQSGFRVQVLYVHPDDTPSRFGPSLVTSLRGWAGQADQIFQKSAEETGSVRNLRFVQDPSDICRPTVDEVMIPAASVASFATMTAQLRAQGYNRTDRIYLAFTDARVYCGVGTLWNDDQANSANWNYSGPSYSRVDAGCWSGTVAAHELMHNLGGVQLSAPNTSGGFHCIDEWDVMCYPDAGAGQPEMRVTCAPFAQYAARFDCGDNDYYNTNPDPGSYLANYWNPANNRFLIGANPPPPPPPPPEITTAPADSDKKGKKANKGKSKHGKGKKHKNKR